jgi:hypothetical protein
LDRAPRQPGDDRLIRLVAGIAAAAPDRTLQQIAAQLEAMRERTPRGGTRWHPSSVKHLLTRAEQLGLVGAPPGKWTQGSGGKKHPRFAVWQLPSVRRPVARLSSVVRLSSVDKLTTYSHH